MANGRCRIHGGLSTGPRTMEGLRRSIAAARYGRRRQVEQYRALGIKLPGGRRPGRWWTVAKDDQEKALRIIADELETLPAAPLDRPLEEWTPAELLSNNARLALLRQGEILSEPISPDMDLKKQRLILDATGMAIRATVRVQEASLRERRETGFKDILAELLKVK